MLKMNALHATSSTLHLRTERCRAARDSWGPSRETIRHRHQAVEYVRRLRFQIVRRVLPNELREFSWMKTFAVREFFEDEIRDRLSHGQRKLRTQARRLRLKRDRREWLRVQNREKIGRDA